MRKIFVTVVILCLATVSAFADGFRPDFVPDEHIISKKVELGKDSSGMTWLLLDYGTNNAGYYAVARKGILRDQQLSNLYRDIRSRYTKQESSYSLTTDMSIHPTVCVTPKCTGDSMMHLAE